MQWIHLGTEELPFSFSNAAAASSCIWECSLFTEVPLFHFHSRNLQWNACNQYDRTQNSPGFTLNLVLSKCHVRRHRDSSEDPWYSVRMEKSSKPGERPSSHTYIHTYQPSEYVCTCARVYLWISSPVKPLLYITFFCYTGFYSSIPLRKLIAMFKFMFWFYFVNYSLPNLNPINQWLHWTGQQKAINMKVTASHKKKYMICM